MRNIKKLLSALIILSLLLSFFAGCTSDNADEPKDTTPEETTYPELKIEITSDEERIYENMTNYVFIPDDEAAGEWQVVDIVQEIEDFDPNTPLFADSVLYWRNVKFFDVGMAILQFSSDDVTRKWTKGYMLDELNQAVPAYTLKQIDRVSYMFVEWKSGDYFVRGDKPWYYVFKKISDQAALPSVNPYDDVRGPFGFMGGDLSFYDFTDSGNKIRTLWFNEKTIFPSSDKMPSDEKLQPEYIMKAGKNPGLGVRSIHEQGITGKGVNVAIIDQAMPVNHPEYDGKIIEYADLSGFSFSMHGPGVTSLLVGENIGTAPGAKVYYYSAEKYIDGKGDAEAYAQALDMIVEKNNTLADGEKIRVVSISAAPVPSNNIWVNGEMYIESVRCAQEAGILVLDCSNEFGIIGACGYDFDNPEDVTLCKPGFIASQSQGWNDKTDILAPIWYRTVAEIYSEDDFSYAYEAQGGLSWGIPYAAGILALGWEIRPELTPDEIVQILSDTAYVGSGGNKYIYPTAFIEYLQNN